MLITFRHLAGQADVLGGKEIIFHNFGFCDYSGRVKEIIDDGDGKIHVVVVKVVWRCSDDKKGEWTSLSGDKWFTFPKAGARLRNVKTGFVFRFLNCNGSATSGKIYLNGKR